jgi:hypothetical protein
MVFRLIVATLRADVQLGEPYNHVDEGEETLSRHGDPIFADHRGSNPLQKETVAGILRSL